MVEPIGWRAEEIRIEGAIDNSLYEALDAQVARRAARRRRPQRLAWDLADVYAWQMDFTRDIQPGDRFQVVFERLVSEDGEVRFGRVLAGDLTMSGKRSDRVPLRGRRPRGLLRRRRQLASPGVPAGAGGVPPDLLELCRARFHPVLGITRRHEGTDYAAAPGTPVMAAGDGVVLRAGRAGGYGNLIELRHLNGITTRYGHLRGFARGVRAGARVEQGQTIGYVGSTGLATRPAPPLRVPGQRGGQGLAPGRARQRRADPRRPPRATSSESATGCWLLLHPEAAGAPSPAAG